jgi:hypothetical protein
MRYWIAGAALLATVSASAQTLVPENRGQQRVNEINQSMSAQQRSIQQSQQSQFETNQLRGEIQRQNTTPVIPPPSFGCAPGARC